VYDFDSLIAEVLKTKPELDRGVLMMQIEEKKATVGSGYLTDQGALFLIAGELGISLDHLTNADLALKDLFAGANDVTVVARVLAVYPTSEYNKKDGGKGRYRRLILFDGTAVVRMTLWDDGVDEIEKRGIGVDAAVRVVSGYVKQGLDGKPNLNLGKRGSIQLVSDAKIVAKLVRLDNLAMPIEKMGKGERLEAIDATLLSEPRESNFTRVDGSAGSLVQFTVTDGSGRNERRVVVWGPTSVPPIKSGQRIRVTNLRVKVSNRGESELHGDSGTVVIPLAGEKGTRFRVAAVRLEGGRLRALLVDRSKKVQQAELEGAAFEANKDLVAGEAVSLKHDGDSGQNILCKDAGTFERLDKADMEVPGLETLRVKIAELKHVSWPVMVEAIALSRGLVQDVHLKDGSIVKKGELVVGDETGEIKLIGWREQGAVMLGTEPGQRVRIVGATPQSSSFGVTTLQLGNFSQIEKLSGLR
jgi:ssDNA-binding replication factor A large subunit